MTWTHGTFYWNELMTHDSELARRFYHHTIGWTFDAMPMPGGGTYWIAKVGGDRPAGGIFEMKDPHFKNIPEHWLAYIAVDDVDKRVAMALEQGATAIRMPFDIEGVGRIAILHEPGNAAIGMITPVSR